MIFSSPIFLFCFLPIVLTIYYLLPRVGRNLFLFLASLFFYAWGEKDYILVLFGSLVVNFLLADRVARSGHRMWIILAVVFNLGLLTVFKYSGFVLENLSPFFTAIGLKVPATVSFHLPIGISFFTFQAMSYVIDVARREVPVQRNFLLYGLYVFLFPHLIAGPIVRYSDIADQLAERKPSSSQFSDGIKRFILGLAKKLLIANTLAETSDLIFTVQTDSLSASAAWLGLACYTLQIYFDFSGYSDMAIGLGKMFGFDFLENFRYPYISQSITEFWRRWHISLSSWFRDYLYIPLGGSRVAAWKTYRNLLVVFLLCGLWHGPSWAFIFWGGFHGVFLILERLGLGEWITRLPRVARHFYVIFIVMIGWVFFRCSELDQAIKYLAQLFSFSDGSYHAIDFVNREWLLTFLIGIVAATPIRPFFERQTAVRDESSRLKSEVLGLLVTIGLSVLFLLCLMRLAVDTYQPFIYFRF
jgi:alginate O-acetyltransferase complex protein AlgI